MEDSVMKKFGWTYAELEATPLHVVLSSSFIDSSKADHDKIQTLKAEEKAKTNRK